MMLRIRQIFIGNDDTSPKIRLIRYRICAFAAEPIESESEFVSFGDVGGARDAFLRRWSIFKGRYDDNAAFNVRANGGPSSHTAGSVRHPLHL